MHTNAMRMLRSAIFGAHKNFEILEAEITSPSRSPLSLLSLPSLYSRYDAAWREGRLYTFRDFNFCGRVESLNLRYTSTSASLSDKIELNNKKGDREGRGGRERGRERSYVVHAE